MSANPLAVVGTVLRRIVVLVVVSALAGMLVAGLALPFAGLTGIAAREVAAGIENLPTELDEATLPQRTKVLDSNGKTIAYFYAQNRVSVPLSKVAPVMKRALLAIEDSRFFKHGALDVQGTSRALVNNVLGQPTQGGSSLTQQLIKQILVSKADTRAQYEAATEQTVARKLQELQFAMAYEQEHSKREILESYLNIAFFGDGAYGISAAARQFFSVPPDQLTLKQAATLAGLVQNPSAYNPTLNPATARERRDTVLARMAELKVIKRKAARRAIASPLGLNVTQTPNGCVSTAAPFFCDFARIYLLNSTALGQTRSQREDGFLGGGLTIKTTIDPRMQRAADQAVRERVNPTDSAIGAIALVEPGTGEVRALSQSRPMGRNANSGETYLNYLVPKDVGGAAGFQAGSTFKAYVLATALKQGLPLSTTFTSPQKYRVEQGTVQNCAGANVAPWGADNSTGTGRFDMYTGTQQSVNTYFAQLEQLTNICPAVRMVRQLGINVPVADEVAPFTLGPTDVSPLGMAAAYAAFPARGTYCPANPIISIRDADGRLVNSPANQCKRVFSPAVGDAINDVLRGVQEDGGFGASNGLTLSQVSAGKTGTTTANKAVWFMGYTPNLVASSMIAGANQEGSPISLEGQTVGGRPLSFDEIGGSSLAGPMWKRAMGVIQQWLPDQDFAPVDESKLGGLGVDVPFLGGQSFAVAAAQLRAADLEPVAAPTRVQSIYPEGTVAKTEPGAGVEMARGQRVLIYLSEGAPRPPVNGGGPGGGGPGGTGPGGGPGDDGPVR
ncbi:MAG: penicillin-binding protein [Nocardioidaceae bacterium]|nr:penicillin-binding protein [Nocardioidaceae bacterium]